jgi:hypothetical protein
MRTTKEYENDIAKLLGIFFAHKIGEKEIRIRRGLKYRSEKGYRCYSPMIDITVGPFSEKRGESLWEDYDNLVEFSSELINDLLQQFRANYQDFGRGFFEIHERTLPNDFRSFLSTSEDVNWNARCFMAIEVENSGSKKHLLGDMLNVSVSGRIGIVIGYNDKTFNSFLRQLEYLAYTIEAKKLKFNSKNIVILKPDQFESILVKNIKKKRGDVRNDSKREEQ